MDSEDIKQLWIQQNETICICKGIPRKRFLEAIKMGASSLEEVHEAVGSGSGDCQGERCSAKIEKLLAEYQRLPKKRRI